MFMLFLYEEHQGWSEVGATEMPEYGQEGIRATSTQKEAQLRCFYTNAGCMGNKQEEQEAIVWSESYDIVATMETW